MLHSPDSSVSIKFMNSNDIQPNSNDSKGPHCPTVLLLQNARERPNFPVYQMSVLFPSRMPRNQNECSPIEVFKDCQMSRLLIKMKSTRDVH